MKKIINKIGQVLKPMLPNLPTDNLYKFVFIGCLALIALLYNSMDKRITEHEQRVFDLDVQYIELSHRDSSLAEGFSLVDTILKTTKNIKIRERAEVKFEDLSSERENLILDFSKYSKLSKRIEKENDSILKYTRGTWIKIKILSIIAIVSCGTWYYRVQKYEDRNLKNNNKKPNN